MVSQSRFVTDNVHRIDAQYFILFYVIEMVYPERLCVGVIITYAWKSSSSLSLNWKIQTKWMRYICKINQQLNHEKEKIKLTHPQVFTQKEGQSSLSSK